MSMQYTSPHRQTGFTLLEIMIALVIFSVGLLGLAGLQAGGLRSTTTAQYRTIATIQAYDMADRIRANPRGVSDGNYNALNNTTPSSTDCVTATCTAAQLAAFDYYEWQKATATALPGGHGTVAGGGAGSQFTVTVMWDEERTGATGTGCGGDPTTDLKCYTMVFEP